MIDGRNVTYLCHYLFCSIKYSNGSRVDVGQIKRFRVTCLVPSVFLINGDLLYIVNRITCNQFKCNLI